VSVTTSRATTLHLKRGGYGLVNHGEATWAGGLEALPCRTTVSWSKFLACAGRIPAASVAKRRNPGWHIAAVRAPTWRIRARFTVFARCFSGFLPAFPLFRARFRSNQSLALSWLTRFLNASLETLCPSATMAGVAPSVRSPVPATKPGDCSIRAARFTDRGGLKDRSRSGRRPWVYPYSAISATVRLPGAKYGWDLSWFSLTCQRGIAASIPVSPRWV